MQHISSLKLNLTFDVGRLQTDLQAILGRNWRKHGNHMIYSGEWSGLALRNTTGEVGDISAEPLHSHQFTNTPLLDRCTYIPTILDTLKCPIGSARLLKLDAGAIIDEHIDGGLCYEYGEARLHIPIITNPQLEFTLNGQRIVMEEGTCWYINANMPHAVANHGATDRVHLVIDVGVNQWVQDAFEAALGRFALPIIKTHFDAYAIQSSE